jgi:hypothetical protein
MGLHPLGSDLTVLSDDALSKRMSDLITKRLTAYRIGSGDLVQQVEMLLFDCRQEQENRNAKAIQAMETQSKNRGGDLDKLIDIN